MFELYPYTIMHVLHTSAAATLLTPTYQHTAVTKQKQLLETASGATVCSPPQMTKSLKTM
jgi:hypothetical protein